MSISSIKESSPSWKKTTVSGERGTLGQGREGDPDEICWRAPDRRLEPYIDGHWMIQWDTGGRAPTARDILYLPHIQVVFRSSLVEVWGVRRHRRTETGPAAGRMWGTRFRPGGFAGFTTPPVSRLNDRDVSLVDVFGRDGRQLEGEIMGPEVDFDGHRHAIEHFLLHRLPPRSARYELVRSVTDQLSHTSPVASVARIAEENGVTVRSLQRAFRDLVGVGPKWVQRRNRIHEAVQRIASGAYDDAASLALDLGYFDQAHFVRDFTTEVGMSPGAYLRSVERKRS